MPESRSCGRHFKPGIGIEIWHDFPASHHGSGPVDNFGKDPRRGMDDDVASGRFTRFNFEHCYDWCVEFMSAPSERKRHLRTFGANGAYIWRAYSKLGDANPRGFPIIPSGRNFQQFCGSNEIYAWRAQHTFLPQLEALFVPCYCIQCRSKIPGACKYRNITHSLVSDLSPKYFISHDVSQLSAAANDSNSA